MIKRVVRMKFTEEGLSEFLNLFEEVKLKVRIQPGCHSLELLQEVDKPNYLMTLSIWESEADLNNYRHTDFFAATWKKTKALFEDRAEAISLNSLYQSV